MVASCLRDYFSHLANAPLLFVLYALPTLVCAVIGVSFFVNTCSPSSPVPFVNFLFHQLVVFVTASIMVVVTVGSFPILYPLFERSTSHQHLGFTIFRTILARPNFIPRTN